jgi:caffeoyl-CoA O-methyltransferase
MSTRSIGLDEALHAYVVAHADGGPDQVLDDLAARTRRLVPDRASMQIAPEQGALLTLLASMSRARLAVEVGTFTGYSSVCIARGLAPEGRLICFDASKEWTDIARQFWARAGVDDRIDLRLGDARELIGSLGDEPVDFAFIDADKDGYPTYYEALLGRLAPDGLIAVDNTLADGGVLNPDAPEAGHAAAIARFNDQVLADDRVQSVLVPVGDGLTLIRHRAASGSPTLRLS